MCVMKLCTYQISRIARPEEDIIYQWRIDITFVPSWAERVLLGRYLPRRKTLEGSYDHWAWKMSRVYKPAGMIWRMWAQHRIKVYQERQANG